MNSDMQSVIFSRMSLRALWGSSKSKGGLEYRQPDSIRRQTSEVGKLRLDELSSVIVLVKQKLKSICA